MPSDSRPTTETTGSSTNAWFSTFSRSMAKRAGQPLAFQLALGAVVLWLISGPSFHFSNTWQLVINTGTTIITFLMVFLIQNSQNRDTEAVQVKLGELIRAVDGARDSLADLEDADDEELEALRVRYQKLAAKARRLEAATSPDEVDDEDAK